MCNTEQAGKPQIAVLGCGYWGQNLVRNFHGLEALAMVCDPTPQGRESATRIAPGVEVTSELERVFAAKEIQGVVIATPAETHARISRAALLAGKHVLVEKPMALTFVEGLRLVRLAQQSERILMVGHLLEYHPAITRLRSLAHSGALGKIRYIYSNRLSLGKVRREENIL